MFRLHGKREHVRVQVFCQLSWQHIRDRCKCWRRSGQKRTHLHPRFRQLICTILWGGIKNKVKNINTHIQGSLQHFNRHQSSKEQKQLISKLTLKTWRLQWRACTLLSTTLTFHLLLVSIHLGLSIDFSHRFRLIARHFLTAVSGHIKMRIYVTNWKRKWWKYKSSNFLHLHKFLRTKNTKNVTNYSLLLWHSCDSSLGALITTRTVKTRDTSTLFYITHTTYVFMTIYHVYTTTYDINKIPGT